VSARTVAAVEILRPDGTRVQIERRAARGPFRPYRPPQKKERERRRRTRPPGEPWRGLFVDLMA